MLVVVKSQKLQLDVQRYLMARFVHGEAAGLGEDKLRYQLMSHREYFKREALVSNAGVACSLSLIEQYYLHKLGLILDQKRASRAHTTESKKRPRDEFDSVDLEYRPDQLFDTLTVHCKYFNPTDPSEIELALRELRPSEVVLYEAQLDFMRAVEVFSARGSRAKVHLVLFGESTEFFQYMSLIEDEKLGFKKLIDLKEVTAFPFIPCSGSSSS